MRRAHLIVGLTASVVIGCAPRPQSYASPQQPKPFPEPTSCGEATFFADMYGYKGLDAIRRLCKPGESISLPVGQTGLIRDTCDLKKSVISSGRTVTCAMASAPSVPPEEVRAKRGS